MDIWRDLKEEVEKYDYNADHPRYEKAAYIKRQHEEIIENNADIRDQPPPLFLIMHTLKGTMHPQLFPDSMSDFLHQFTLVEFYRLKATQKAALALQMDEVLGEEGHLNDEVKGIFNVVIEDQQGLRDIYMKVLTKCIFIDLQQRWVDSSITDFWIHWNEFLSFLRGPKGTAGEHKFQATLSKDEVAELHKSAVQFSKFMAESVQWAEEHRQGGEIQDVLDSSPFRKEFPCPAIPVKLINYYLDFVQRAVDELEKCGHNVFDLDQ